MRFILCLAVGVLLLGCEQGPQGPAVDAGSEPGEVEQQISLEPGDLEKLATWDEASQAGAITLTMLTDVMATIEDETSAKAAIPQLKALAPKIAAVARAQASLGEPSPDDLAVVEQNMAAANSRFEELSQTLSEDPQIDAIVGDLIFEVYTGHSMDE